MILYRGTKSKERLPFRGYRGACVFFTSRFDTAADYAAGEKSVDESGRGWVQKYDVGRQQILDAGSREARHILANYYKSPFQLYMEEQFLEPADMFVQVVTSEGYSGLKLGDELCLFWIREAVLLSRWRVTYDPETGNFTRSAA